MPCHKFNCLLTTPKYITKPCIPPCPLWLSMNNSLMRVISRKKSLQIAIQIIKFIFKVKIWMRRFTLDFFFIEFQISVAGFQSWSCRLLDRVLYTYLCKSRGFGQISGRCVGGREFDSKQQHVSVYIKKTPLNPELKIWNKLRDETLHIFLLNLEFASRQNSI